MSKKCYIVVENVKWLLYNKLCWRQKYTHEGVNLMPKTVVRENESLDDALRRFKRQVNKAGILTEARKREFYLKPGLRRKMKSEMARRKSY